ncbi:MAG: electron transfer flavoprotein subunit alpha/FixB family protein [Cellvibrionales bacterium]|nr:electron transfer flavoprotein subunit alpha/FixB family protein [Cellvibrionales bacterium]
MPSLLIADHQNTALVPATRNAATACAALGEETHILIAGHDCTAAAESAAKIAGITKVLIADSPAYAHLLAENTAALIARIGSAYRHILMPATTNGKNILPRAAALLDSSMLSDIIAIKSPDTFKRPIYAGNAIATVQVADERILLSVRATAFDPAAESTTAAPIEPIEAGEDLGISRFEREELSKSDRPELTEARVVISGGRGLQSGENFQLLYDLADKLDAAVGASRAAVDAGYVANDLQVGQTGRIVAPQLYIAVGLSGAIQHLAGMKESKVIVAINKDPEAPIFQVADYGLAADLFQAIPELTTKLP